MKLLFLLTYYTPHWTGLTEHARRLAEALPRDQFDVTVLATKHESSLQRKEKINTVNVIRSPVLFRLSRTLISPALIWDAWREIGKHDTVIMYTPMAEVALLSLFARIWGKRLLIVHNGDLILPRGLLNWIMERIFDVTGYVAGSLANQLIAYSDDYAKHSRFLKHFLPKTTAILPLFPLLPAVPAVQKRLRALLPTHHGVVIGFAGRFVEEKGFDILLQAIPHVLKKIPNALFVFAGETHMVYEHFFEQHQRLLASVHDHFFSFGRLSQEEMRAFYPLLDLFVLPSRSDCLAFVQVEAMLVHIPVVVTNIPGARVPVQKTGMGKLVSAENPEALAEGILDVIKQKKEYTKEWHEVQKMFDYRNTVEEYVKVIKGK